MTSATSALARLPKNSPRSAAPLATTLPGMNGADAMAGSWASTIPPAALTARAPAVPSRPMPVSTIASTRGPKRVAADANSGSAAGRVWLTFAVSSSPSRPSPRTTMCRSGGATWTVPARSRSPSAAKAASSRPQ
jgi:hypothetical protein